MNVPLANIVAELRQRVRAPVVTRYAPSPTGYLHIGHVASAIYVWGVTRALGGKVVLRIENTDQSRARPEYEQNILIDLKWLGFLDGEFGQMTEGPLWQTDSLQAYEDAAKFLRDQNRIYFCNCSRKDISETQGGDGSGKLRYPGTCRPKNLPYQEGLSTRLRVIEGEFSFFDARHGTQTQNPATSRGDILIRDRLGQWTFLFASAIDDLRQNVNLVIRGDDLLEICGEQLLIKSLMGAGAPVFFHHPLAKDDDGTKLSKRLLANSIRNDREKGLKREQILGQAAYHAGLIDRPDELAPEDLEALFKV
jgi:glutamyl-tRNA synthetase/glutamyl-Q tRNA(Asp) synthetase